MSLTQTTLVAWLVIAVVMAVLWEVQRRRGNAGIVDLAWSLATGLTGAALAAAADGLPERRHLIAVMALLWAGRLGIHLWRRLLADPEEDVRYRWARALWGPKTQRNLFVFFQVQAVWALLFAVPMASAAKNPRPLGLLDAVGVVFFAVSVIGESIADRQLRRFRQRTGPGKGVCRDGLWGWSRHPNYFFEWLHWFAYPFLAAGAEVHWVVMAVLGVPLMLLFLYRITGIPVTEARLLESRGNAYRDYQRNTSAFFPWPPRR
ncbi:MAG: DUF1295 domain-containing protein [Acidobacteriota bacterium]